LLGFQKEGGIQMDSQQTMIFQKALDVVESLPEYQQENLIDIIRHRLIEHRRELLAENIREARKEYARGEVKKGTVDDLMRELSE
jgi:hypothetical protein